MIAVLLAILIPDVRAQSLPRYDIVRATSPIIIDGKLDDAAWQQAQPVGDFHYNWWKEGEPGTLLPQALSPSGAHKFLKSQIRSMLLL